MAARIVGFGRDQSTFQANGGTANTGVGLDVGTDATHGPATVENVTIEGFGAAFVTPVNGLWTVRNMTLTENGTDLYIQPADTTPTEVQFNNVVFSSFQVQDEPGATELPPHITTSP